MTHPLAPTTEFSTAICIDIVGQSLQAPSSVPFVISGILGQNLCYTTLALPLFYPSAMIHQLAGKSELTLRRIAWMAPAVGISLLTLVGRVAFEFMPNSLLKGLVYGVHSCAMAMLTNIPSGDWLGVITLRKVLVVFTDLPSALEPLSYKDRDIIWKLSEMLASVALVTASLGLSFFGGFHVVTANTIGHVAAAATKVVSARVFAHLAAKEQEEVA
ncbi:MAG: hypothetical protein Q8L98_01425 [Chlamydiales bacterium]|nr:hypothetical protein [Chlamydiales bacterium]